MSMKRESRKEKSDQQIFPSRPYLPVGESYLPKASSPLFPHHSIFPSGLSPFPGSKLNIVESDSENEKEIGKDDSEEIEEADFLTQEAEQQEAKAGGKENEVEKKVEEQKEKAQKPAQEPRQTQLPGRRNLLVQRTGLISGEIEKIKRQTKPSQEARQESTQEPAAKDQQEAEADVEPFEAKEDPKEEKIYTAKSLLRLPAPDGKLDDEMKTLRSFASNIFKADAQSDKTISLRIKNVLRAYDPKANRIPVDAVPFPEAKYDEASKKLYFFVDSEGQPLILNNNATDAIIFFNEVRGWKESMFNEQSIPAARRQKFPSDWKALRQIHERILANYKKE